MEMLHDPEFWVAVGFVLVLALLVWKGVPRMVAEKLDQRSAVIAAELEEAKRLREEAAALLADYQRRAAGAEAEARSILDTAASEAAQFQKHAQAALEAQIARRAASAQDKIAQAEAAALHEIRGLAADTAVAAARKLIAARLDEKRAGEMIADSIKGLAEKLG
jgi:F-type H+-transporting ATPase subunit b